MKYLVHLRPPQPIIESVEAYRKKIQPSIASVSDNILHCTLMLARFHEGDEKTLIRTLDTVSGSPLSLEIGGFDLFERDSLVARIQPRKALAQVHLQVIEKLRGYIQWDEIGELLPEFEHDSERRRVYETYGSPFYAQFYQPHISLAHVKPDFSIPISSFLTGQTFEVSEFYLSKKKEGSWQTLHSFHLKP